MCTWTYGCAIANKYIFEKMLGCTSHNNRRLANENGITMPRI